IRGANDAAEALPPDALEINNPIGIGKEVARPLSNQFAFRKLIFPLDVEGSGPKVVLSQNLDSYLPWHNSPSFPCFGREVRHKGFAKTYNTSVLLSTIERSGPWKRRPHKPKMLL